jgi:antitoxin component of RelBE/YafQ-DinJ toxin-antitoxin module
MEEKSARLTVLIDADKKKAFEDLCASQDITVSQAIRQLIREYLKRHAAGDATTGFGERRSG